MHWTHKAINSIPFADLFTAALTCSAEQRVWSFGTKMLAFFHLLINVLTCEGKWLAPLLHSEKMQKVRETHLYLHALQEYLLLPQFRASNAIVSSFFISPLPLYPCDIRPCSQLVFYILLGAWWGEKAQITVMLDKLSRILLTERCILPRFHGGQESVVRQQMPL